MANRELITAHDLAKALNLSVETVWRYTREKKKIPYIELGSRQYRYKLSDVIHALTEGTVREEDSEYKNGTKKKYTYQDYLDLPEEPGFRFEVLEGELVKDPSPNVAHQRASRELLFILSEYFKNEDPQGELFHAPLDVTLDNSTVVQPDIFYVSGFQQSFIETARIDGSPTLVIEILSPFTNRKDRLRKMRIYQQAGVKHYWLVNPEDKTLECFSLREGIYAVVASGMEDDIVEHPEFMGLSIALTTLW